MDNQLVPWLCAGLGPAAGVFFGYLRDRDKTRLERDKLLRDSEIIELRLKLENEKAQRLLLETVINKATERATKAELEAAELRGRLAERGAKP